MPETLSLLPELGFHAVHDQYSNGFAYELPMGKSPLCAARRTNRYYKEVIIFSGIHATSRSMGEFAFELQLYVASIDHLKAFLAYYLWTYWQSDDPDVEWVPTWFAEGSALTFLLPWEVEAANYQERPHCYVQREWMKLFLRDLAQRIESVTGHTFIEFSFDGSVLLAEIQAHKIVVGATGTAWNMTYVIPARRLFDNLPKRLAQDSVEIGVHDHRLRLSKWEYCGVLAKGDFVYWMPHNAPSFVMPLHQLQVSGVIRAVRGQQMDTQIYFSLLAERIQDYASHAIGDEATKLTFQLLENSDLTWNRPELDVFGQCLIVDNFALQEHLKLVGVTAGMPKILETSDPAAEAIYYESDLDSWSNAVSWNR